MLRHDCKSVKLRDISNNFYKATAGLAVGQPIVVTKHGHPAMTIFKGDHSIGGTAFNAVSSPNSFALSARAMNVYQSSGFSPEDSEKIVGLLEDVLGNKATTALPEEVKDEKDK